MISSLLGRRLLFNPARFQNLLRGRVRACTRIVLIAHPFVLHLRISFNPLRIKHKRPALLQPLFPFRRYPRFPPLEHIRQLLNLPPRILSAMEYALTHRTTFLSPQSSIEVYRTSRLWDRRIKSPSGIRFLCKSLALFLPFRWRLRSTLSACLRF